jgi:hypothetical protein
LFPLFTTGINNTSGTGGNAGGKFSSGVLDQVVHLDFLISPGIFGKIRHDPNGIFRGLGNENMKQKIS